MDRFLLCLLAACSTPTDTTDSSLGLDATTRDVSDATRDVPSDVAGDHATDASATRRQPDIVVVMADDLDEGTLQDVERRGYMPHLAALREAGTSFESSFVTLSLCCPSRASFLTGRYPHNTGVLSNVMPEGSVEAFDDRDTLATWLTAAGYHTSHVGKYLNRYGRHGTEGVGALRSQYVPPGWSDWQVTIDPTTYSFYDYSINDNGTIVTYGGPPGVPGGSAANYQTDVLADRAVSVIERTPADQPLFLVITPLAVHLEAAEEDEKARELVRPAPRHAWILDEPLDIPRGPAFDEADVSDKSRVIQQTDRLTPEVVAYLGELYRGRAGSLLAVDDLIGAVRDALTERGRIDDAILVFTSDNGWLYGEHRVEHKRFPYEESIRVPLVIADFRAPRTTEVASSLALNIDLAPTIAEWAGASTPEVDGRSLTPLLRDAVPENWRRRFFVRGPAHSRVHFLGVRTADTDSVPNSIYVQYQERCNMRCEEMYRLDDDPFQLDSVHRRDPDRSLLGEWVARLQDCRGEWCLAYESCASPFECQLE